MYLCLFGLIICLSWAHSVEHPYTKKTGEVVWPEIAGRYFLTEEILEYEFENVTYEGYVAYPAVLKSMPGVLVAHQYMGLGEMEKFRAREAASFGNLAFALDYYGKRIGRLTHPKPRRESPHCALTPPNGTQLCSLAGLSFWHCRG